MSVLNLTEQQVLSLIRQLPAASRREALLELAREADSRRDQRMAEIESRFRDAARERGVDWNTLDEAAREQFVDRLLHEA